MTENEVEHVISTLLGRYGWMFVAGVAILTFKNIIQRLVEGFMFFIGNDYNADDIVYINGTKKARIIRHGLTKTVFYIYETDRKLIIRNDRLSTLHLEKSLPQNGNSKHETN